MTDLKTLLLRMLKDFISFCDENHLTYYAAYGTVLGAVRHHGFIPWDDDIDIQMPRADYQKLWELRNNLPAPYKLANISEIGYTAPFMKFMDTRTSIWEFERIPYMIGVYIDVFPLDEYNKEDIPHVKRIKKELDVSFRFYFQSLEDWSMRELFSMLFYRNWRELKNCLEKKLNNIRNRRKFHNQVLTYLEELSSSKRGTLYVSSTDVYLECPIFEKSWFENPIDVPFEDLTIKIPSGYDNFLRSLYGDYMTLPPIEERKTTHSRKYVSLAQGLTIGEVRKLLRKR